MVKSDTHQQVGYILRSFPRLSQTFVLNEILALEELGLDLQIFALENPRENLVQERVAEVRARVHYLNEVKRQGFGRAILQNIQVLSLSPWRYFRTLLTVLVNRRLDEGYHTASRLECFWMAVHMVWLIRSNRRVNESCIGHLHAHFAHDPALVALLVNKLTGISFSFTTHARDLYQLAVPALHERAKEASVILTCCTANLDYLARVLPETQHAKVRVIHHGVDVKMFSPMLLRERSSEDPVIISVGRLVEKKGFPVLLEAFHLLKKAGYAFSGMIYGDGPLRDELDGQIKQSGLEGLVTLAGARKQEDLLPILKKATLFALTPAIHSNGDRDGIPNVLVEAMACGLPVVSTEVAGVPELVIHGHNGLLYQPHDVKGIAAGLVTLLSDEDRRKRLGEAARQTVLDSFDLRAGAGQIADLFRQMGMA